MSASGFVIIALVTLNSLLAGDLELCVENRARLDESTLQSFRTELDVILVASNRLATYTSCRPGVVTITLRREPPAEEATALGRTGRRNGLLVPEIDLFVDPVTQLVGVRLPGVVGRALARVATHELGHWLTQGAGHSVRGVMVERFSAAHLMARDRGFFRLPPGD